MTVEAMTARIAAGLTGVALLGLMVHLIDGATDRVSAQPSASAHVAAPGVTAPDTALLEHGEAVDPHVFDVPPSPGPVGDAMPRGIQSPPIPSVEPFNANELLLDGAANAAATPSSIASSMGSSLGSSLSMSLPMMAGMYGFSYGTKALSEIPSMLSSLPAEFLPSAVDGIPADILPFP